MLRGLGSFLAAILELLEASGGLFGTSWAVLEASWEAILGVLEVSGRPCGDKIDEKATDISQDRENTENYKERCCFWSFRAWFEGVLEAFWGVFEASGGLWEASWTVLEASGGVW